MIVIRPEVALHVFLAFPKLFIHQNLFLSRILVHVATDAASLRSDSLTYRAYDPLRFSALLPSQIEPDYSLDQCDTPDLSVLSVPVPPG